jgi:di/tricarboxylate transporter
LSVITPSIFVESQHKTMDPIVLVFAILVFTIVMFIWEKIPIDLTALIVMALLIISGAVTLKEGISGFSNEAVVTIMFLYIMSAGLEKTGAVNIIGRWMLRLSGKNKLRGLIVVMIISGLLSGFLNNTAVVVIFLPIVFRIARFTNESPSKLLLPLSFASISGGTLTLIGTSTNILVSGISEDAGYGRFSMFEFTLIGGTLFVVFIIYMLIIGVRMIPRRRASNDSMSKSYDLKDFITEISITPGSPWAGKRLRATPFTLELDLDIIEIKDQQNITWLPDEYETLEENDILVVRGSINDIMLLKTLPGVSFSKSFEPDDDDLRSNETTLIEVVIGPNSSLARSTFDEIEFRELFDAIPLAVRRSGELLSGRLDDIELRFGDDLLLEVRKESYQSLLRSGDFIFTQELDKPDYDEKKVIIAFSITAAVIMLAALNILPIIQGALLGIISMFLFKLISIREAYRDVDWRIIFLLAALIPLGIAIEKSGAADLLAGYLNNNLAVYGPGLILVVLFAITTILTSVMSNGATAVLLSPIAISLAEQMGIDPRPFLFAVMFAASTCYLTPLGYQTNIMVYGPGNYKFSDFFKVGGLLSLLTMAIVTFMLYTIYF